MEDEMKKTENINDYKAEYNRIQYDRISVYIPKGMKEELKRITDNKGLSVNALINKLLQEYIMQNTIGNPDSPNG